MMKDTFRLQSALGKVSQDTRTDLKMQGYASLAIVTKVHHKNNTADVRLIRTNNIIVGSSRNEGRFSCRILCTSANYDKINKLSSGVIEPVVKGQLVLVSFLEGLKHEPVIVASMHSVDNTDNILVGKYPLEPDKSLKDLKDYKKFLRVFPTQDYLKVDGKGDMELSLHSKSFLMISEDNISDDHLRTDFEDLSEKNKFTGSTLTIPEEYCDEFGNTAEYYRKPKKFLFVHRDCWHDPVTTWTKFFIDDTGLFRITRDNRDNTLTYLELSKEGQVQLVRQLDASERGKGVSNTSVTLHSNGELICKSAQENSNSIIKLEESGTIAFNRTLKDKVSSVTITETGDIIFKHSSGSTLSFTEDGNITLEAHNDLILKGKHIFEN